MNTFFKLVVTLIHKRVMVIPSFVPQPRNNMIRASTGIPYIHEP
jgi:hypothetical protein